MEIAEIIGYGVGFLVGVIMGLLGGGGSLLLPAMLYLLDRSINLATAYTTCLVGITALFGVIPRLRTREIDMGTAIALGIPVSLGTLIVRLWLFAWIPENLFSIGNWTVSKQFFVLFLFACLLLLSFATMVGLIGRHLEPRTELKKENPLSYYSILVVCGLFIGIIPGFTGAGGGVLIVPLLVIFFGVPMQVVVGTSLTIIAAKSLIGFFGGDVVRLGKQIEWDFLGGFSIAMIAGVLIGSWMSKRMDNDLLKRVFAWFILALAIFILTKEIFFPPVASPGTP